MNNRISEMVEDIRDLLIEWRRDFHTYAEAGWVEFRTASLIASRLYSWGYEVRAGRDVMDESTRMGVPNQAYLEEQFDRAIQQGANTEWAAPLRSGFTGVVGTLDTGKPGPTIGLRFDMDALDLQESSDDSHFPVKERFTSVNDRMMHACGHDAHMAIGLGIASLLAELKDSLNGKFKLIFQPAEEGVRGAKSMVKAGVVDDVDIFISQHVGLGAELGEFVCSDLGFLATTKLNVRFLGKAAHAGANPEKGKNALLAAATATLNLHAISPHSSGESRINVGVLHAGTGRNIIPNKADLQVETRGATTEINEYMVERLRKIVKAAGEMYEVETHIEEVGSAPTCTPSEQLVAVLRKKTTSLKDIQKITHTFTSGGSEDATYMMSRVKENGGQAAYVVFGTTLSAGHHNEKFDIDEEVIPLAVKTLVYCITQLDTPIVPSNKGE
ncbi:peptidase M20 [Sporosarcina sp. P18a]|uniref:amidohydrolase n=1 Tax=Sporosarcina sp. P18a TaxID=2048259 RepID=UPI000C164DB4|nr:amidohydrolase [Sporosarcina sp. P18a]PIC80718.1 peptidase M20 [Sporosarcina sp. P18a]